MQGSDPYALREIGQGFLYPPPALLIIGIFSSIASDYLRNSVYLTFNFALLALMLWSIARHYGYSWNRIWWWFPLAFGFAPTLESLHIGQINLITQFGIALLFIFGERIPFLGGAGIALATFTKVTPVAFFGFLLIHREWRAAIWGIVLIIAAFIVSAMFFGWQPIITYPDVMGDLTRWFIVGGNSQSLVVVFHSFGWIQFEAWQKVRQALTIYIAVICILSGSAALISRQRESFFIVLSFAITILPNLMWYHHFVFFLLPVFVWIASSRFHPIIIVWCLTGLLLTQVDRWYWTHGLMPHLFAHLSILAILISQFFYIRVTRRKSESAIL